MLLTRMFNCSLGVIHNTRARLVQSNAKELNVLVTLFSIVTIFFYYYWDTKNAQESKLQLIQTLRRIVGKEHLGTTRWRAILIQFQTHFHWLLILLKPVKEAYWWQLLHCVDIIVLPREAEFHMTGLSLNKLRAYDLRSFRASKQEMYEITGG